MVSFIEIVKGKTIIDNGFRIINDGKQYKKLVIPNEFNGSKLEELVSIDSHIAYYIEEIEFPDSLVSININIFKSLKNVKKIVFNVDLNLELSGIGMLEKLKEVEIKKLNSKYGSRKMYTSFSNLKNLEKITILEQPYLYLIDTVYNCPKLDIQSMIGEGLIELQNNAFDKIGNSDIILPKSLNRFNARSFIRSEGLLRIKVLNKNTYLHTNYSFNYKELVEISGLTVFKHLENIEGFSVVDREKYTEDFGDKRGGVVIIRDKINDTENIKLKKIKTLGVKVNINGVNTSLDTIKMSLMITDKEHIRNTINENMRNCVYNDLYGFALISNGYTSISFEIAEVCNLKEHQSGNIIEILNNYVIVKGLSKIYIYSNNKEHIINNIDKYYDEEGISLRPIRKINNKKDVKNIREEGNELIIEYKDGRIGIL